MTVEAVASIDAREGVEVGLVGDVADGARQRTQPNSVPWGQRSTSTRFEVEQVKVRGEQRHRDRRIRRGRRPPAPYAQLVADDLAAEMPRMAAWLWPGPRCSSHVKLTQARSSSSNVGDAAVGASPLRSCAATENGTSIRASVALPRGDDQFLDFDAGVRPRLLATAGAREADDRPRRWRAPSRRASGVLQETSFRKPQLAGAACFCGRGSQSKS